MPRCPRCEQRASKRPCPALAQEICALCCGEGRLRAISCPQDCPYLGNEEYQRARRDEQARSSGREFLLAMGDLFSKEELFDLALWLQAQVYAYLTTEGARVELVDDSTVAQAYEAAARAYSPLLLPELGQHPLAAFVLEKLRERDPHKPEVEPEDCRMVLRALSRYARSSRDREGRSYKDALESFYRFFRRKGFAPMKKLSRDSIWRPGKGPAFEF